MLDLLNPLTTARGDSRYPLKFISVTCLETDTVGNPVYVTANPVGDVWSVATADSSDEDKVPAVGVLVEKATTTTGIVQLWGLVKDVYTGLQVGRPYYVGTSGLVLSAPAKNAQKVGVAQADNALLLPGNIGSSPGADQGYYPYFQEVACLSSDSVGDLMCIRGLPSLAKWRVQKADPFDSAKMPMVGVLMSKSTPTVGVLQVNGPLVGMFTGLDYTKPCFVGASGLEQAMPQPVAQGQIVSVQNIGFVTAEDGVFLTGNTQMIKRRG